MMLRYPLVLLLLLVIPALLYVRYARRRKPALGFSDGTSLSRLTPSWAILTQPVLPVLYALALFSLVVALARPQKGLEESRVRMEAVDIVLLIDVSGSMETPDFSTVTREITRLDAVKEVVAKFVERRRDDRIGVVAFGAIPYTVSPLTLDHGWLVERLQSVTTRMFRREDHARTAMGDGMASAINRLRQSKAKSRVIVLLTDGVNNFGRLAPADAAQAAKALGIKVYTVGAASDRGAAPPRGLFGLPLQQASEVDEETLKHIADVTGASYFRARDYRGLENVYAEIDRMEKTEINVEQYTRFQERFMPWVLFAMICLGLEKWLALTRLGRLP